MNDRRAATCQYTYVDGKHYVTISFGKDKDDWLRIELKREHVLDLMHQAFDRVVPRF